MSTEHDWVDNQQRFLGYRVTNTVRTVIRSVTQVGETIDAAVAAGGGDAQVNNLVFSIEDDTALLAAARDSAWDDAQAKATQLASLAGRSLGKALSIVERTRPIPGPFPVARMRTESDAGTPIEGGTSVVVIDLEVRYELS
jgi:uncharacterized protein YggE